MALVSFGIWTLPCFHHPFDWSSSVCLQSFSASAKRRCWRMKESLSWEKGLKELSAHVFSKICPKPTFTFQAFIFVIYLPRVHTQGINWIWQQGKVSLAWLSESAIGECLRGLSDFNTFNHWLLPSWTGLKMKRKIPHWCKIVSGFELAPPTPLAPSSYPVSFSSTMMSPLWPPLPPSQSPVDLSHDRYLRYFIISSVGESSKEDLKMNEALLRCLCNGAYLEFT